MRRFWRIAKRRYALDKSCEGNRAAGGRWNNPGYGALYAAATIELATLERFVHTAGIQPAELVLVAVDVPEDSSLIRRVKVADLPAGWNSLPASDAARDFGTGWLKKAAELVLLVPSVIVPEGINAVINPLHLRYTDVVLNITRDFEFDPRMYSG